MFMNEQTLDFIRQHRNDDVRKLALQGAKGSETDLPMALQQIAGWQTARKKLPSWATQEGIVYPPHLNMEQCSSEQTARYKQRLVERLMSEKRGKEATEADEMERFVDLTGGLGVDFYWMSQGFKRRHYVERNAELCTLAEHNFHQLGLESTVVCASAADVLPTLPHANVIFLDPARRNEQGGRTYGIEDCTPNVLELLPTLLEKAHFIIVKLSPMLDWRKAVSDLKYVQEVHIVSVDNECKELLLVLDKGLSMETRLFCVNMNKDGLSDPALTLSVRKARTESPKGSDWQSEAFGLVTNQHLDGDSLFLYEPNASIMKAGCFAELEQQFHVRQLSANSHLFVSSVDISNFPGRRFQINVVSTMNKQDLKTSLSDIQQANISVRNFPLSADQLRKKLKLKDGGNVYIFATTLADGQHRLLICRKIG